jgi:hypothetical protein
MNFEVGQRWRYGDTIVEIVAVAPLFVETRTTTAPLMTLYFNRKTGRPVGPRRPYQQKLRPIEKENDDNL